MISHSKLETKSVLSTRGEISKEDTWCHVKLLCRIQELVCTALRPAMKGVLVTVRSVRKLQQR